MNYLTLEIIRKFNTIGGEGLPIGVAYHKNGALPMGIVTRNEYYPIPRWYYTRRDVPPRLGKPFLVENDPRSGACRVKNLPTFFVDVFRV